MRHRGDFPNPLGSKALFAAILLILSSVIHTGALNLGGSETQFWTFAGFDLQRTNYTPKTGDILTPGLLWKAGGLGVVVAPPAVADIDSDGAIEVLYGDATQRLICLNGRDGSVKWTFDSESDIMMTPALKDVDGDRRMEIFFAGYDLLNLNFRLQSLKSDGTLAWTFEARSQFTYSSPAVDDVDNDGADEVIIANRDRRVYCLDARTGFLEWEYFTGGDCDMNTPAVADIDGDGRKEIVIGNHVAERIYCLSGAGKLKWVYMPADVTYGVSVSDIDGDGLAEVFACGADGRLYCLRGDGKLKWWYKTDATILSYNGVGIADMDADGAKEIVFGSCDGKVYCLTPDGSPKWARQLAGKISGSPALGDFDRDRMLEVFIGDHAGYAYLIEHDGSVKWKFSVGDIAGFIGVTAEDVDGDGSVELLIPSYDRYLYCFGIQKWTISTRDKLGKPVPNIRLIVNDTLLEAMTDHEGLYRWFDPGVKNKAYTIEFHWRGILVDKVAVRFDEARWLPVVFRNMITDVEGSGLDVVLSGVDCNLLSAFWEVFGERLKLEQEGPVGQVSITYVYCGDKEPRGVSRSTAYGPMVPLNRFGNLEELAKSTEGWYFDVGDKMLYIKVQYGSFVTVVVDFAPLPPYPALIAILAAFPIITLAFYVLYRYRRRVETSLLGRK